MPFKKFQVTKDTCNLIPNVSRILDLKDESESVRKFISDASCRKLILNLRGFNLVDSTKIAMLVSAHHYSKYAKDGSFRVVVDSEETVSQMKKGYLNNVDIVYDDLSSDLYGLG
jgi:hypothetical protein